jgi:hypothetical protein
MGLHFGRAEGKEMPNGISDIVDHTGVGLVGGKRMPHQHQPTGAVPAASRGGDDAGSAMPNCAGAASAGRRRGAALMNAESN